MSKIITSIAAKAITDTLITNVNNAVVPFAPFKINLTASDKIGSRSMAEGREGYARLVSRIANQNPNALSRADNPSELANLLDYYNNLEGCRIAITQVLEMISETQLGAATDIMTLTDRYVANLQISRGNDASLDNAMQEVDDYNSRFGKSTPTPP